MTHKWDEFLSPEAINQIHDASMKLLANIGVKFPVDEAIDVFKAHGVKADGHLVYLEEKQVMQALETVPDQFTIHARNPDRNVTVGDGEPVFTPAYGAPFLVDPEVGKRAPTMEDYEQLVRLAHALPNLDFHMSLGIVQDVAVGTYDPWQYLAMLEGTNKPINITAVDLDGLRDQLEMAHIRVGGKEEWKKGPIFSLYIEPVSPLSHSEEVIQKLLFASDNDIPFVYTPCPLAGATSPCTLAGTAVQALTESLFGIVLSQLRKPGAQLIIGGLMSNMDMRTTVYCYGSPEMALLSAAYTQITKWLGVPEYETAGCSDAKLFDEQAAMEATNPRPPVWFVAAAMVPGFALPGLSA